MALTSYSELQASVADWLARSDLSALQLADCVTLFESTANRRLRVREMEKYVSLPTIGSNGVYELPTDYLAWRSVATNETNQIELQFVHLSWMNIAFPSFPEGTPQYFTIAQGSTLYVVPTSDVELNFTYYQKIPALSATNTTNWLLEAHPDLYLFGTLTESNAFVQDEKALIWKARRDEIFGEIERLSEKTKGPSSVRPVGPII